MTHPWRSLIAVTILAAVALAACGTVPTSPPATASPAGSSPATASPGASAPAASGPATAPASAPTTGADPCGLALAATSSGWGGAAGSRGADVTVTNEGALPCTLPPVPATAILDASGSVVLQSDVRVGASQPTLEPGASATFSLLMSNWCDESVALPLRIAVVLPDSAAPIAGLPAETIDDLPQCLGPGQPATLSTTDWELN